MQSPVLCAAKSLLRCLGFYSSARAFYNRAFLSRTTRTIEINGISATFRTPTHTIAEQVESLTGEAVILRHFLHELRPDDIIWDVGANFGLYTLFAAPLVHSGRVYAFEPEQQSRTLLERNIRGNRLSTVEVCPVALGDEDSPVRIYSAETPNVGTHALVQRKDYKLKQKGTIIGQRRGDSLTQQGIVQAPQIVKIDVEGAECKVLTGMGSLLCEPALRWLYCEIHPAVLPLFGDSPSDVEILLHTSGFAILERHQRGTEYHLICRRSQ